LLDHVGGINLALQPLAKDTLRHGLQVRPVLLGHVPESRRIRWPTRCRHRRSLTDIVFWAFHLRDPAARTL
jgi:hypothetical protein